MFAREAARQREELAALSARVSKLESELRNTNAHLAALLAYLAAAEPIIYAPGKASRERVNKLHIHYIAASEGVFPGLPPEAEKAMLLVESTMKEGRKGRLSPP